MSSTEAPRETTKLFPSAPTAKFQMCSSLKSVIRRGGPPTTGYSQRLFFVALSA